MKLLDRERLLENIEKIAAYDFSEHKVFGSAYWVCAQDLVVEKCYGVQGLDSARPVTASTVFRLASMTKPITAVATLILVERGLLSLDDPVDRYLTAFKSVKIIDAQGASARPEKIPTVRQILTHTSGIGGLKEKIARLSQSDKTTLDASIAFFLKNGLDFEPGSKQMYSGFGAFDVLTKIIEKITGTDYLSFLQREIFAPCEMWDTTFTPSEEQRDRMIEMHDRVNGANATFAMPKGCIFESIPQTHYLGGAGLASTLHDYFASMLLNRGRTPTTGRILKESTFFELCTPQISKGDFECWGLGVRVIAEEAYPYLPKGCFGWSGAYGSHFWIDPENKIAAVFMKNSKCDGGAANESARKFEEAVYSSFA